MRRVKGWSGKDCALPSWGSGGSWGPRKKNQFCTKNYAILSKFWHLFPILQHKNFQHAKIVISASEKVGGDYPPVLKVGGSIPVPPPCSDAYGRRRLMCTPAVLLSVLLTSVRWRTRLTICWRSDAIIISIFCVL